MGIRKICLNVWSVWDPIYYKFTRLHYVENESGDWTIMRVRMTRYKGRQITLLLKIHLYNVKLLKETRRYDRDIHRAFISYKIVEASLSALAKYIESQGYTDRIKGLIGITTLSKGCRKLGFEVYPFGNRYYKWFKQFALLPIHLLSGDSLKKKMPTPMYVMRSKEELLRKYI